MRHGAGDLAIDPAHVTSDVAAFEEAMRSGEFEQALALYRGEGFAPVGRRPGYYRRPDTAPADAVILARQL